LSKKLERLLALEFPVVRHIYDERDLMLYALGLGLPRDPASPQDLAFVYEADLRPLPTFSVVAAHPGFWMRDLDTGLDPTRIVHGEQTLRIHRPLPLRAEVVGRSRIVGVADKGPQKGAVVYYEREIETLSGEPLATVGQAIFCRGDGGMGSGGEARELVHAPPDRQPDVVSTIRTSPRAALIYRLSGDYNPLHADPVVASEAGFARPILHGLATFGTAGIAVLESACNMDPSGLAAMDCRFRAPVYPGETLETSLWLEANTISFQTRVVERDVIVLSNGRAERTPMHGERKISKGASHAA
jgi:acyl dehydratase